VYNAQSTIQRVQSAIKAKKVTQKEVLSKCDLSENTLKKMSDTNGMASFNLAKIADYLDVSVDYLLCRVDNPQAHKCGSPVTLGDVSNSSGIAIGNSNSSVTINSADATLTPQQKTMLDVFNDLSPMAQAKLMVYADSLKGN